MFVNLGVKGSEKTIGALGSMKTGLGEVKGMSLEAKAGIAAVFYGMERLMSQSAQAGTGLTNFAALTGLSAKQLQQWQYAARQAGVSGEEFTGSLKNVQSKMTDALLKGQLPEGFGLVKQKVGLDHNRLRDTFYVMEQLQKFAKTVPPDIANNIMKSFGLSEGTIAAMQRQKFNAAIFKKAPSYSAGEISQNDKVNVAWGNLGQKIEMAMGRFTAKHGMQLVGDLSQVTNQVIKMVEAFQKLAEQLKVFQVIGKVFEGWSQLFNVTSGQVDNLTQRVGKDGVIKGLGEHILDNLKGVGEAAHGAYLTAVEPSISGAAAAGVTNNNFHVNQNMNFQHDGKDHRKTGDSVRKAVQDAHRQMSVQRQVN